MKIFHYLYQNFTWTQPKGYDTGIKVYNCLVKDKVPLIVRNKNYVSWYTCGPTVYDSAHIGHASCYVKLDIIQRILQKHFNLRLVTCMNITDVDDKIIKKATDLNRPCTEITQLYETEFWKDLKSLNVTLPNVVVNVTSHIPNILQFIKALVNKEAAYVSKGSVYFNVDKYKYYNKLQQTGNKQGDETDEKQSSRDFALWKSTLAEGVSWPSEWGPGRPGWHIECSTLASAVFGSAVDIHAGGIDLRFPHHENEEAQSCCFHDTSQWVNYWLHTGHLSDKNAVKMSKSLQNTIKISELLNVTDANTFRMVCLLTTYRQHMTYSLELLNTAASTLNVILSFLINCEKYCMGFFVNDRFDKALVLDTLEASIIQCDAAFRDDFDTAAAVKSILSLIHIVNKELDFDKSFYECENRNTLEAKAIASSEVAACQNFVSYTLEMLGVILKQPESAKNVDRDEIIDSLIEFRKNVRLFALSEKQQLLLEYCDQLRNDLKKYNVIIKDYGKVSSWNK